MPLLTRIGLVVAVVSATACQAPTAPMDESDVPGGRILVTNGLAGGERLVALADAATACGAPELWLRAGPVWRQSATGAAFGEPPCALLTAALSADGTTLAVHDFSAGRAEIHTIGPDGFSLSGTAAIEGPLGSRFPPPGANVALSGDGSRLLLGSINRGCRFPAPGERYCGVAVLFERRGDGWRRAAVLLPPEEDGATRFGQSVALSADGTLAVVGGTGVPGSAGRLWVYRLDGDPPQARQSLTAPRAEPEFGSDLSLARDGSWLAVSGEQSVHLFAREGDAFAWRKSLTPPDTSVGYFGDTVALSGDGRLLLVGAPRTACAEGDVCGAAFLYGLGGEWSLARVIRPETNAADANFGHHLALSGDGTHAAVQGSVIHVFTLRPGS